MRSERCEPSTSSRISRIFERTDAKFEEEPRGERSPQRSKRVSRGSVSRPKFCASEKGKRGNQDELATNGIELFGLETSVHRGEEKKIVQDFFNGVLRSRSDRVLTSRLSRPVMKSDALPPSRISRSRCHRSPKEGAFVRAVI